MLIFILNAWKKKTSKFIIERKKIMVFANIQKSRPQQKSGTMKRCFIWGPVQLVNVRPFKNE